METLPPSQERIRAARGGARLPLGERDETGQMLPGEGTEKTDPKGLGATGQGLDAGSQPLHGDSSKPEGAGPAPRGWRRRGQAA